MTIPEQVLDAIGKLPEDTMGQRGFTFPEIAQAVGCSATEVHASVLRLRDTGRLELDTLEGSGHVGSAVVRL